MEVGDVCLGDVVLFRQKVYEKFNKVTRHGRVIGNRTVAGRVVKESYGAAKQQHTFT
ncbi:zinc finger CCCH domain-containing protein 62-like, partial [Trifolium medium]|nr:zinc finger CCCH domain-containing protein 62-like [Trifolium medium]